MTLHSGRMWYDSHINLVPRLRVYMLLNSAHNTCMHGARWKQDIGHWPPICLLWPVPSAEQIYPRHAGRHLGRLRSLGGFSRAVPCTPRSIGCSDDNCLPTISPH